MKLEFKKNLVREDLYRELDFDRYLSLFDLNIPLIPSKILVPMDKKDGTEYFRILRETEEKLSGQDLVELISGSKQLPYLDNLMPFFRAGKLEQYHLFELGNFVSAELELQNLEKDYPVAEGLNKYLVKIREILERRTEKSFSIVPAGSEETALRNCIEKVEEDLKNQFLDHERQIFESTGLRMIYPYPKELSVSGEIEDNINNCALLTVTKKDEVWLIDHKPGEKVAELINKRDGLNSELTVLMQVKLSEINIELESFYGAFKEYYERRKNRTWMYCVLYVKNENNLALPVFQEDVGCTVENGYAYSLLGRKKEKCVPLRISLDRGSNVLFGANMSGKTTVLKTVYFLLTAIRAGLPVPAEKVTLNYPQHVALMLKSSGDMNRGLSSFGEEISFFTGGSPEGSYILSDELFLSTDPVNGAELSEIFIKDFSDKKLIFFCTTHYAQNLDIEGISLFRMLDPDLNGINRDHVSVEQLISRMPYKLQRIAGDDCLKAARQNRKPLEIALLFPLPEGIKDKIEQKLKINKCCGEDPCTGL